MTVHEVIHQTTRKLEAAGIPSPRLDAEVLLAFCLGCDRIDFIKNPQRHLSDEQLAVYERMVARRLRFEPVAYITGVKAFWSFTLEVNPDVLIPRPDTEVIVEEALAVCRAAAPRRPRILDIGTGSGAIALALAKELPEARITATDISPAALAVAQKNARLLGLSDSIIFQVSDLFEQIQGTFDMIVSNPPYIGAAEYETLEEGVRNFEPKPALLAGQTGVEFYEKLIYQARSYLNDNGWLLLEIGARQSESVQAIMKAGDRFYSHIDVRTDYAGLSRVIKGRRR